MIGALSSGSSWQDFCSRNFGPSVIKSLKQQGVFASGPEKPINSLGIFSGNGPAKNLQEIL